MDSVEWWIPSNIKFSVLLRDLIGVRQRYQPKGCLKGRKSTYEQFYFTSVIMKIVLVHCLIKLKWNNEGKLIIWVELEQKTVIWESSAARFSDDIYGTPLKWNWWLFNYQSINRLINCSIQFKIKTNESIHWLRCLFIEYSPAIEVTGRLCAVVCSFSTCSVLQLDLLVLVAEALDWKVFSRKRKPPTGRLEQ